jgi:hypothetical protein
MRMFIRVSTIIIIYGLFAAPVGSSSAERQRNLEDNLTIVTGNYATAIDQQVTASIDKTDLIILALADELQSELAAKGKIDTGRIDKLAALDLSRIPELNGLRVTDQTGRLIAGTGVAGGSPATYGDRDFFTEHRTKNDRGLIVTPPLFGRVSREWVIILVRRFNRPDGSFAGVIAAAMLVDHLTKLLSTLDLGPEGVAVIREVDLGLVTRYPLIAGRAGAVGDREVSKEFADQAKSGKPKGIFQDMVDGIERTNSYRLLSHAPFFVIVGMTKER